MASTGITPGPSPAGKDTPKQEFRESPGLLTRSTNVETKRLYVAATRMNDGKTTTCLGLFEAMGTRFPRIGFIKPVGQRFVHVDGHIVDEDSYLLERTYNVRVPIESMSPIAVDATFTRRFLEDPEGVRPGLVDRICRAFDRVSWEKDFTLIEGTGHAGVGAVFDLSNARVARLLDAKVLIVAQGGIGRPVDEIALNKALFDHEGVEVIGAVLNKVHPEKLEMISEVTGRGLKRLGIDLLGVLPNQQVLTAPNLSEIAKAIDGRWINAKNCGQDQRILRVIVGAMTAESIIDSLRPGVLLITPGDRDDIILAAIACSGLAGHRVASGIVLTRDIMPNPRLMELLGQTSIPVIAADGDSYTIASRINRMTVKTQPQDSDKIPVIKRMITENVDLTRLVERL
ncbi:MAG: AAA family ATPase [Opitutaceae bacterium]